MKPACHLESYRCAGWNEGDFQPKNRGEGHPSKEEKRWYWINLIALGENMGQAMFPNQEILNFTITFCSGAQRQTHAVGVGLPKAILDNVRIVFSMTKDLVIFSKFEVLQC